MPFEFGMDKYLKSFAPVPLDQRLKLKSVLIDLRRIREKVEKWYKTAAALEESKPMKDKQPTEASERVTNRVDYAFGNYYDGAWLNGKRHGQGEYLSKTKGYFYRGEWKCGNLDGQGCMFICKPDNTWSLIYIGNYKKGQRDGWGTCRWSEDEFYEGLWIKGKRKGWGRHFSPDGTIYEGQWHDDKRSGYGTTREGFGNHHFGEYCNDVKHGSGKYFFTKTGKSFHGVWCNDSPIFGEIVQLKHYQPTFPYQYPLPELGLKDPVRVLKASLDMTCKSEKKPNAGEKPEMKSFCFDEKILDNSKAVLEMLKNRQESMDMKKILKEIEPDIAEVTDPVLAAQAGDYLLAIEYLWRSNADQWGLRPKRVRKLLAENSQEF